MKKGLLIIIIFVAGISGTYAQEGNTTNTGNQGPSAAVHYSNVYQRAMRYNDFNVAKHAMYNLVSLYPQNDSLLFSLSFLYFQMQQYASSALTARDVLSLNPDHTGAMEISALSLSELGARDKAIEAYEQLYMNNNSFETLYQLTFLQYEIERYNESLTNVNILLSKKEAEELTVNFSVSENEQKEYPIKAALLNLKGLIYQKQGNTAEARKFYNEALAISPDFPLAKENLAALDKK